MPTAALLDLVRMAMYFHSESCNLAASDWVGLAACFYMLVSITYFAIPANLHRLHLCKQPPSQMQAVAKNRLHPILFITSCGLSHLIAALSDIGVVTDCSAALLFFRGVAALVSIRAANLLWQHADETRGLLARTSELELWYSSELESTNRELTCLRKAAEDSAQTSKRILSSVSHELRTPIHAIKGAIEALQQGDNKEQMGLLNEAQASASTLLDIVTKILTFTNLSRRQFSMNRRPTSVAWVAEQAMELSKLQISDADLIGVLPCMELSASAPLKIVTDEYLLVVALRSIVENAIKYTDKGHVALRVFTRQQTLLPLEAGRQQLCRPEPRARLRKPKRRKTQASGCGNACRFSGSVQGPDQGFQKHSVLPQNGGATDPHIRSDPSCESQTVLVFQVTDTGIGIPKELQSKIFDHLWRVDSSNHRNHSGLGLGLAICTKAMNLLGGQVQVYDNLFRGGSCGSIFELLLPIPELSCDTLPWTSQVVAPPSQPSPVQDHKVIIASDESVFQESLESLLRHSGVTAITSCNRIDSPLAQNMVGSIAFLGPDVVTDPAWSTVWSNWEAGQPGRMRVLVAPQLARMAPCQDPSSPVLNLEVPVTPSALAEVLQVAHSSITDHSSIDNKGSPRPSLDQDRPAKRFLIVDDNKINLKVAESMVARARKGAEIVTADDGLVAVEQWKQAYEADPGSVFDVVLMDLSMPRLDGRGAVKQLRRLPMGERPFVAALTGDYLSDSDMAVLLEEGFDKVLVKPMAMKTLKEMLSGISTRDKPSPRESACKLWQGETP
mmetsp:Transcript_202/g.679  ORF Transcript_202/g.679 Transcript_202/m.679 type:complete len:785 (+) Transcript_202:255-2609(+)|eukprot:CAMPEP_0117648846 /NCGR_PEP_ID=MMETSP0804-20121206/638_1 /TAXON_ID=1074897 /ORGANISM="Tetraselmis astigmatica, Strain CCMP880" /LENGTH=784 /DNA_ID=CAMNT_0005454507 /DNA_START=251 /DNA_END=2605 /DNA_ORIENTATION=-